MRIIRKKNSFISIKDKLIIYFLLIFLIVGGILTTIIFISSRQAVIERTVQQLATVNNIKKKQIEQFFVDRQREIDYLTTILYPKTTEEISKILNDYIQRHEFFISVEVYSNNFENFSDTSNISLWKYYSNLLSHNNSTQFISEKTDLTSQNNNRILFVVDFSLSGSASIAVFSLNLSTLYDITLSNKPEKGFGLSGETYLVGKDFLMRSPSRFIPNSILKVKVESNSAVNALNNLSGTIVTNDYRQTEVLSSYSSLKINNLHWAILSEIDMSEALKPVDDLKSKLLIISIFLSLFIFIITYLIAAKITKPIIKLTEATKQIGKGEFNLITATKANDEIAELTDSFNSMTSTIMQKDKELEEEQLKRFRMAIDAQETERKRLSKELHDGLGQMFSGLKLKLESLSSNQIDTDKTILEVKNGIDGTINEIRRISNNLMPWGIEEFGIVLGLKNLCNELSAISGISINFSCNIQNDLTNSKLKLYIYRIVQEALNNIIKHSKANNVEVKLLKVNSLILSISDDGAGFVYEERSKSNGNGLYNMKERALSLNGKFSVQTEPGKGTVIICNIPEGNHD